MMRAVIYARFSSDLQRAASIDDQIRICRERIERDGYVLAAVYQDKAVSGASLLRPGIQQLLNDGGRRLFDVVYAEALDRLSRDQEDVAAVFKRLQFADVPIITIAEGCISELHVGLKGTMNALFLKDLAEKTRRGLRGRVEAGLSGGGNSFGYDVVVGSSNDDSERGERRINPQQAEIIVRIFKKYVAGSSPRAMAKKLNQEGVVGPSGGTWGPSSINGNVTRGTGILHNELYVGRLVWNRLTYRKDPETGKRRSRLNPQSDWIIKFVPDLRIVTDELWQAAIERQKAAHRDTRPEKSSVEFWNLRRPQHLLSGLMKCGSCGASYTKYGANRFGCAAARSKATCTNLLTVDGRQLEALVLDGLKRRLMEPDLFAEFAREFIAEVNRERASLARDMTGLQLELASVSRGIEKLVSAIIAGADALSLNSRLKELESRKAAIARELEEKPEAKPALHPNLAVIYREKVANLERVLQEPSIREEGHSLIRSLIDGVRLTPVDGQLEIELKGDLAGVLAISEAAKTATERDRNVLQIKVVAGAGFEPTTFRL